MIRQVNEISTDSWAPRAHITSLRPLRTENGPDAWERGALERFERGEREFVERLEVDGAPVLRYMARLTADEGCLKCHAGQGYQLGEVRGGLSVTIPLTGLPSSRRDFVVGHLLGYGGIWLLGGMTLVLGRRWAIRKEQARERDAESLRRAEEYLAGTRRLEAIGRLAGGVAHDMNNLLTPILVTTELLRESLPEDGTVRTDLDEIRTCAERAAKLTRQLLSFGRQQVLTLVSVDATRLAEELLPMLERLAGPSVRIETHLTPSLPTILADRGQVEIALVNLAANARDAMPAGGVLGIRTGVSRIETDEAVPLGVEPGSFVEIEISDTGIGIPPDILPHIFEPFFTTKSPDRGAGLGLPSVYGVVRQQRGCISVESEPGRGTRFRMLFPIGPAGVGETAPESQLGDDSSPTGSERILVVEDEPAVLRSLTATLEGLGYRVRSAADGEEALRILREAPGDIDLLLTDLLLPGLDGRRLAERYRTLRPEGRVLLISGHPGLNAPATLVAGSDRLLRKPFAVVELAKAVRAVLDAA